MGSGQGKTGKETKVQVKKTFEIRIHVEDGSRTLNSKINGVTAINFISGIVDEEFNRVAKRSSNKKVKKGFDVKVTSKSGSSMRVFDVYIIGPEVDKAMSIAEENHGLNLDREIVSKNFNSGKGFGTRPGTVSDTVAFALYTNQFHLTPGPFTKTKTWKDTMGNLAEHVIHELGHTMGAEHQDGGVMSAKDKGKRKFEPASIAKINQTLEGLV